MDGFKNFQEDTESLLVTKSGGRTPSILNNGLTSFALDHTH